MTNQSDPRLDEVWKYAWDKLREHNLSDWYMGWDNGKRRYGQCDYQRKRISISRLLASAMPIEETKDTVLHEIAHALAGPKHGHDKHWKEICVKVGAKPRRCWNSTNNPLGYRYEVGCPDSCWRRQYHRLSYRMPYLCQCRKYIVVNDKATGARFYWQCSDTERYSKPFEYTTQSGETEQIPQTIVHDRKWEKTELKPWEYPPRYEDRKLYKMDGTIINLESEPV